MEQLRDEDPRRLGRYTITGRIGAGSMGVVYLAQTPRGTPAAVKTLTPASSSAAAARFRREVEASLRVSSPFTARVLDADLAHDPPYLVSEYVAGETLAGRIHRAGPVELEAAVAFAAATAAGLAGIHTAGVVHRDLSPNNVILGIEGPRIVDLGVAAVTDATRLTATGMALGTPGFMSPEHARGDDVGPPGDMFAWASLVCFAVSGQSPFGVGRADTVLYRIVHEPPDIPPLPQVLDRPVRACLAKEPADRPAAADIATQLTGSTDSEEQTRRITALLDGRNPATRPYGVAETPTVPVATPARPRHRRRPAIVGAAVVASMVAGAVYAATRPEPETAATATATSSPTQATAADTPREPTPIPEATTPRRQEPASERRTPTPEPAQAGGLDVWPLPDLYTAAAPHPLAEQVDASWVTFIHRELSAVAGIDVTGSVCGSTDVALEFTSAPPSEFVCVAYTDATPTAVFGAAVSADSSEWWRWGESTVPAQTETQVLACWQPSAPWLPEVVDDPTGDVLFGPAEAAGANVQALGLASIDHDTAVDADLGPERAARYAYGQLLTYCARE